MKTPRTYYPLQSVTEFLPGEEVAIILKRGEEPRLEVVISVTGDSVTTNKGTILSDKEGDQYTTFLTGEYFPQYATNTGI